MKIRELFETEFSSDTTDQFVQTYRNLYESAVEYFDIYVQQHGTDGANVEFSRKINDTKNEVINFLIKSTTGYHEMVDARNKLEEKIKNSNGLSY